MQCCHCQTRQSLEEFKEVLNNGEERVSAFCISCRTDSALLQSCNKCGESKDVREFSLTPANNPRKTCKACRSLDNQGITARSRKLKNKYNITHDDYLVLLEEQEGKCLGCGTTAKEQYHGVLDVDHNHVTGEVRGLLCSNCNRLLGFSGDNARTLRNLANYVDERGSYVRGD